MSHVYSLALLLTHTHTHLCKALLEVVVNHVRLITQDSKWDVITHAIRGLNSSLCHALHDHLCVLSAHAIRRLGVCVTQQGKGRCRQVEQRM